MVEWPSHKDSANGENTAVLVSGILRPSITNIAHKEYSEFQDENLQGDARMASSLQTFFQCNLHIQLQHAGLA